MKDEYYWLRTQRFKQSKNTAWGRNAQLWGNAMSRGCAPKIGWVGKKVTTAALEPVRTSFPLRSVYQVGVTWWCGTTALHGLPLEIVLASVCGLALPNYCICSAEFWTAGSSKTFPSAARQQRGSSSTSKINQAPHVSRSCLRTAGAQTVWEKPTPRMSHFRHVLRKK